MTGELLGNQRRNAIRVPGHLENRIRIYKIVPESGWPDDLDRLLRRDTYPSMSKQGLSSFLEISRLLYPASQFPPKVLNQSAAWECCQVTPTPYISKTLQGACTFFCSCSSRTDHTETPVNAHKQNFKRITEIMPGRPRKGKNRGKDWHCNPVRKTPDNIRTEL